MDEQEKRRGKITPENLKEAEVLLGLWHSTYAERKKRGLHAQGVFGAEYGIGNQAAVGHFLNGKTALSKKAARGFAKGLGCAIADFSPRLAAEIDALAWPFQGLDAAKIAALGPPQLQQLEAAVLIAAGHLKLDVAADHRAHETGAAA